MAKADEIYVERCCECPFNKDAYRQDGAFEFEYCSHPELDGDEYKTVDRPPEWCPLRTARAVVILESIDD